mmetsp:Transcript_1795/g.3762  ORF Transcript_1795/g.3762 Transcript_1795/m.3762 type:complete len:331 (+) Transcript_1795:655-1647(+)
MALVGLLRNREQVRDFHAGPLPRDLRVLRHSRGLERRRPPRKVELPCRWRRGRRRGGLRQKLPRPPAGRADAACPVSPPRGRKQACLKGPRRPGPALRGPREQRVACPRTRGHHSASGERVHSSDPWLVEFGALVSKEEADEMTGHCDQGPAGGDSGDSGGGEDAIGSWGRSADAGALLPDGSFESVCLMQQAKRKSEESESEEKRREGFRREGVGTGLIGGRAPQSCSCALWVCSLLPSSQARLKPSSPPPCLCTQGPVGWPDFLFVLVRRRVLHGARAQGRHGAGRKGHRHAPRERRVAPAPQVREGREVRRAQRLHTRPGSPPPTHG